MTSAVTVEEERGQREEAQPPAFEGEDMEAVRAYMLRLLTEGRGEQAIEMLLGLLGQLREENSSMAVRLKQALRQLYGRRSEKTSAAARLHTLPPRLRSRARGGVDFRAGQVHVGAWDRCPAQARGGAWELTGS
jgi:hypothetical protein